MASGKQNPWTTEAPHGSRRGTDEGLEATSGLSFLVASHAEDRMTGDRVNPCAQLCADLYMQPWQLALRVRARLQCKDPACALSLGTHHAGPCVRCTCGAEHAIAECPEHYRSGTSYAPKSVRPFLAAMRRTAHAADIEPADATLGE